MKARSIMIGVILVIFSMGLCGCINNSKEVAKILDYTIETQGFWQQKIGEGFYHHKGAYRYEICGTVKNTAGYELDAILINASFYNENDVYLGCDKTVVGDILDTGVKEFEIFYYYNDPYFEDVEKVKFSFSIYN